MERMEKLQSVDAETTSVLRPTQFKSDSRKLKAFWRLEEETQQRIRGHIF